MAPTTSLPSGPHDWNVAKSVCSQQDIERLACAFLNTQDISTTDWKAAAEQFGTGAQGASFKRVIWNMAEKLKKAAATAATEDESGMDTATDNAGGESDGKKTAAKPKAQRGRKRKAQDLEPEAEEGSGNPVEKTTKKKTKYVAKKTARGKRGKKGAVKAGPDEEVVQDDDGAVKMEEEEEDCDA